MLSKTCLHRQLHVFDCVSNQTKQPIKGHGQYLKCPVKRGETLAAVYSVPTSKLSKVNLRSIKCCSAGRGRQSRAKCSSQSRALRMAGMLPPEDDFPLADSVCVCSWFLCACCLKQFAYVFAYVHRQPKMYDPTHHTWTS